MNNNNKGLCLRELVFIFFDLMGMDGHWNDRNLSICLYAVENKPEKIKAIRDTVEKVTRTFNFIVLDPNEPFTNINILDIDL